MVAGEVRVRAVEEEGEAGTVASSDWSSCVMPGERPAARTPVARSTANAFAPQRHPESSIGSGSPCARKRIRMVGAEAAGAVVEGEAAGLGQRLRSVRASGHFLN